MTVLVTINPRKLEENIRTLKEGAASGAIEYRQSGWLEKGQQELGKFFQQVRYENFLEIALNDKKIDLRKGLLNVTVTLEFDRERYRSDFEKPLAWLLDEILASSPLERELEIEFDDVADRQAATFALLGNNLSVRMWLLPRNLYDIIKRYSRFWDVGEGRIHTHKRLWLHFSLKNADGEEIERLPVQLTASNVLLFSDNRKETFNPWFFMEIRDPGRKKFPILVAAPAFGTLTGKGYVFFENFVQIFAFQLPETTLQRVDDVGITLELER